LIEGRGDNKKGEWKGGKAETNSRGWRCNVSVEEADGSGGSNRVSHQKTGRLVAVGMRGDGG